MAKIRDEVHRLHISLNCQAMTYQERHDANVTCSDLRHVLSIPEGPERDAKAAEYRRKNTEAKAQAFEDFKDRCKGLMILCPELLAETIMELSDSQKSKLFDKLSEAYATRTMLTAVDKMITAANLDD